MEENLPKYPSHAYLPRTLCHCWWSRWWRRWCSTTIGSPRTAVCQHFVVTCPTSTSRLCICSACRNGIGIGNKRNRWRNTARCCSTKAEINLTGSLPDTWLTDRLWQICVATLVCKRCFTTSTASGNFSERSYCKAMYLSTSYSSAIDCHCWRWRCWRDRCLRATEIVSGWRWGDFVTFGNFDIFGIARIRSGIFCLCSCPSIAACRCWRVAFGIICSSSLTSAESTCTWVFACACSI